MTTVKIRDLVKEWERSASGRLAHETIPLHLDFDDAARLEALAEMYPKRNREELLAELVSAALDELEGSFPYVKGTRVVAEDELGDPLYEDVGPTPRFLKLTRKHVKAMKGSQPDHH